MQQTKRPKDKARYQRWCGSYMLVLVFLLPPSFYSKYIQWGMCYLKWQFLFKTIFQGLTETTCTNAFGPLLMGKHFSKLLLRGNGTVGVQATEEKQKHTAVMVNISAKVGSITDNGMKLLSISFRWQIGVSQFVLQINSLLSSGLCVFIPQATSL